MMKKSSASNTGRRVLVIAAALLVTALALNSGCGLETEKANRYMEKAAGHQAAAEAIIARLRNFPAEWEAVFNVSAVGPDQVQQARAITQAREQDIDALAAELTKWKKSLRPILELNVDAKVKEYVKLKIQAIESLESWAQDYLLPLVKSCQGMVEILAYGRPDDERRAKADEIAGQTAEAAEKLAECQLAIKTADNYFTENKLGR